jgi:glycosyltransferase involved in cell wall biosynthesis
MRILLAVHQFMPEFWAGTETLTLRTAQELKRRGHHVSVLTGGKYDPELPELYRFTWSELPIIRLNVPEPDPLWWGGLGQTYRRTEIEPSLKQILLEVRPDLVHIFHLRRLTLSLVDLVQKHSIPVVFSLTDYWFGCFTGQLQFPADQPCAGPDLLSANCLRHIASRMNPAFGRVPMPIWRLFMRGATFWNSLGPLASIAQLKQRQISMRKAYSGIQRVLAPSSQLLETYRELGFDMSQTRICPYGIDVSGLENLMPRTPWQGVSERPLKVAFVGTFNPAKGAHVLLDAVARLHCQRSISVRLYGSLDDNPAYSNMLQFKASDLDGVEFAGIFSSDRIYQVLSTIDLLIVPSLWRENSPLILLQAMASGLPVVASNVPGMADHIHSGINGELFEPGNSAALAELLERLVADPHALQTLTSCQLQPRTISDYVNQIETCYHGLLSAY